LCNTYEGSSEIKSSRRDTYNRQYHTFSQKPGESLDDCFARFESIVSSLHSCGPLAYSDNERAKQLLYAIDDSVWGMKITALEESAVFATLDTEKLFSKLKSRELRRKGRLNHDSSLTSKAFVTSTCIGGHVANPTNTTDSSALEFSLSSLCAASNEQYESKKNRNDSNDKGEGKKKYHFGDKKFQKMMSRACAVLSDLDISSDDSSSSEEDESPNHKTGDFTGLCLMGKSSWHIFDSDSDVSDDSSPEGLSL
jgi:hypothetical protein